MKWLRKNGIAIVVGNIIGMTHLGFNDWRLYALVMSASVTILMRDYVIREEEEAA